MLFGSIRADKVIVRRLLIATNSHSVTRVVFFRLMTYSPNGGLCKVA